MRSPEGESGPARDTTDRTDGGVDGRADGGVDGGVDGAGTSSWQAPPHGPGPVAQGPPPPHGPQYPPPHAGPYPPQYPQQYPPPGAPASSPPQYGGAYPPQYAGPYPPQYAGPYPPPAAPGSHPPGPYPPPYGPYPPHPYPGHEPPAGLAGDDGRARPPRRTHRWGLGAFVLAEAVFLGVSLLVGLLIAGPDASVAGLGAALAVPTVLAAGVAVLATRLRGNGPKADLGLVWSGRDVAIGLGIGFGGLVLALMATAVFVSVVGPDVTSAVGDLFGDQRAGPAAALMILLIVVLVAPLCEEILYRGLLWGALEKLGAGPWLAFGLTTVAFAFLHFELVRAPLLLVISIPIGLARLYTGRLLASVVAHQVNNLLPGIALYLTLTGALPV